MGNHPRTDTEPEHEDQNDDEGADGLAAAKEYFQGPLPDNLIDDSCHTGQKERPKNNGQSVVLLWRRSFEICQYSTFQSERMIHYAR